MEFNRLLSSAISTYGENGFGKIMIKKINKIKSNNKISKIIIFYLKRETKLKIG